MYTFKPVQVLGILNHGHISSMYKVFCKLHPSISNDLQAISKILLLVFSGIAFVTISGDSIEDVDRWSFSLQNEKIIQLSAN